jgi:hypothetical protein
LTFSSDATRTAIIREVLAGGGTISGDVEVERHFPMGNRAFRYISSPVTSTAFIRDQWQEGQNNDNTTNNSNTNPGFGTHITGTLNGPGFGFDATETGNPSLFTWDNSVANPAWASVLNTNATTLTAGKAHAILIRGDRSADLSNNDATGNSTKLRSWGVPKIGQHQATTSIDSGEFALIGNPYQAQIDLTEVTKTDFGNFFYIWDPTIGGAGNYAAVQIDGSGYIDTTPSSGTEANQFLQVGQAFFIEATAASPSITFEEAHKTDVVNNLQTFSVPNYTNINVNLYRNNHLLVDGLRIQLSEDFEDEVNFEDALKLWNTQEQFAIDKNQSWLMVERRSIPQNEAIQFYLNNYQSSQYQFQIQIQQLEDSHQVYLHDAYLAENFLLDSNQENTHSFEVDTSIPESIDVNRFSLHFEATTLADSNFNQYQIRVYPNPVTQGNINLSWPVDSTTETTTQITLYDVLGKAVWNQENTPTEALLKIDVSTLPTGIYVLKANRGTAEYTTKVIVE